MITVKLSGGLGNQLFQYAAARALAIKKNTKVKLDLTTLHHRLPMRNYIFRTFDLDLLGIQASCSFLSRFSGPGKNAAFLLSKLLVALRELFFPNSVFTEKEYFYFDKEIFNQSSNVYLDGFWQSYRYFEDCRDIIREEFSVFPDLSEKGKELAAKIRSCRSVCIAIRRDDYVSIQRNVDFFGVLPLSYFQQAIQLMKERIKDPFFFIFTDDIDWCRENFTLTENVFFVTADYYGERYIEKFHLMTLCKNFIIANSTFAWWPAWLNSNPDKVVIAPKNWVTDKKWNENANNLIPDHWIRI